MSDYKKADLTHSAKKVILKITLVLLTNSSCISLSWGGRWVGRKMEESAKDRENWAGRKTVIKTKTCSSLLTTLTKKP